MSKNIFICHRPYHILRSCDIIKKMGEGKTENVLFSFDVVLEHHPDYQRFITNKIFYPFFNKVIEIGREMDPSPRSVWQYVKYCKRKKKEYVGIANNDFDSDAIYFFCDDELDIEIMLSLFVEYGKSSLKRILIDEGMVTYADTTSRLSWKGKFFGWTISKILGLKNFNWSRAYGGSKLYNYSLASNPEMAHFRKPIEKLTPLSDSLCSSLRNIISRNNQIDDSKPYFIYVTTSLVSFEKERTIIEMLLDILKKHDVPFYIKHHPQQNTEPFEAYINKECFLEKGYPVELFYGRNAIIGGVGSSSLANAFLLGYCVIDMSRMLDAVQYNFSANYNWLKIRTIESMDEMEELINNIKNKD